MVITKVLSFISDRTQGEGSGPLVAWLHQTADGPPRKDLAQVVGNLKVRVKGVRKLRAERETMDPGQTPQDPNQLPNVPGELAALCLPACVCVYQTAPPQRPWPRSWGT